MAARTDPTFKRRVKITAGRALKKVGHYWPHNDGIYLRKLVMSHLNASRRVETSFIVRDAYFGGNPAPQSRIRTEYIQNILESDYVLCVRGNGNFSFRFFETMSLGRTPVLIDTDCVLPLDFMHDYRDLCVIVDRKSVV